MHIKPKKLVQDYAELTKVNDYYILDIYRGNELVDFMSSFVIDEVYEQGVKMMNLREIDEVFIHNAVLRDLNKMEYITFPGDYGDDDEED